MHYPAVHWEASRSQASEEYCIKEDSKIEGPWEFGHKPIKRQSKHDWEKIRDLAKQGKIDEVPADIYVKSYSTLKRIAEDHHSAPDTLPQCRGIIITGEAGLGKTSYVRSIVHADHLYLKPRSKWWDGYQN